MARKPHLQVLSDDSLGRYMGWLRRSLSGCEIDWPMWLYSNLRSELVSCIVENSLREEEGLALGEDRLTEE